MNTSMDGGRELEFAPFRSLEDFILESARFQIPPYKDLEKWNNRIVSNLLYYQTNYFVLMLIVFLLVGIFRPAEMLYGFLAVCLAFAVFAYATSKVPEAVNFKKDHPIISVFVILAAGYFLVCMFSSILVFVFGIALPMLIMFLHASTRLRNMRNRVANKLEAAGFKKTPMGHLLGTMGIELTLITF